MKIGTRTSCTVLLVLLFGATAVVQTQQVSDREFLTRAVQQVHEYVTAFHDLTAEETATVWYYGRHGRVAERHTIVSSLIIYRSQADPSESVEYRDVISVNGRRIKDHGDRAMKLLGRAMDSKTVAEELARISKESNRYNRHASTVNNTLRQAIALSPECLSAFQFEFQANEDVGGIATRIPDPG